MNAFNMTCEAVDATIPDYLDETLEPWLRTAVQEHLGECVRCAGLVRDLRNIQRDAAALPDLVPARDLWNDIERGIGTPVVPFASVAASPTVPIAASPTIPIAASQPVPIAARHTRVPYDARPYDRRFGPLGMSLAAAALVVVTASTTYLLTVRSLRPTSAPNVATAPSSPQPAPTRPSIPDPGIAVAPSELAPMRPDFLAVVPPGAQPASSPGSQAAQVATASLVSRPSVSPADPVYENEVEKLQTIMTWRKAQLNPATAAIIEHNLGIIDAAIARSKEALRNDPASPLLSNQLTHALNKKVELLRRAAMLAPST